MSSLASYLLERGQRVSGSDAREGPTLHLLRTRGASIVAGSTTASLRKDVDEVVHSAAVPSTHAELQAAQRHGIPTVKYARFLGDQMREKRGIAIAGTHGKTTTTALVAHVLREAGRDPSLVFGGFPHGSALPGWAGAGEHLVVEACEYDSSFLQLLPRCAIVTNVEADHLDYFGCERAVVAAFQRFLALPTLQGPMVVHESAAARLDLSLAPCRPVIVGTSPGVTDRLAERRALRGLWSGVLEVPLRGRVNLAPSIPGRHSLHNAALAASLAVRLGVDPALVERAIHGFSGVRRRLEPLGIQRGVRFYSDYAHHPTEVRAVRETLRELWPECRLIAVFQPHQASRTRDFHDRFVEELAQFDEVVFPGIFCTREEHQGVGALEGQLCESLTRSGRAVRRVPGLAEVLPAVENLARDGDVVVLMGAGDIDDLAEPLRVRPREAAGV